MSVISKVSIISIAAIALAGCSGTSHLRDPNVGRSAPEVIPYEPGMKIPAARPYIESNGKVNSIYEPIVHCHMLHYPNKTPQQVCRIVK